MLCAENKYMTHELISSIAMSDLVQVRQAYGRAQDMTINQSMSN